MIEYPETLYVEPTTRCNMRCAMCVKQSPHAVIEEGDLDLSLFRKLDSALPHCKKLIFSGIGEPLLHPHLSDMIRFARERMPAGGRIGVQSNGVLLTAARAEELLRAGLDTICLSLDSMENEPGEGLRHATGPARTARNFNLLHETALKTGKHLRIGIEFVAARDNFRQLPEVVRTTAKSGGDFVIVSHFLPYSTDTEDQSLFDPNSDRARELYLKWKEKARAEGLDLRAHQEAALTFFKTPEQKKVAELVNAMRKEAFGKDVWVNTAELIKWDSNGSDEVREVFRKAEETARRTGMELRLPALNARYDRSCEFLEEKAAFIDRSGRISPCHFLWHTYRCVMDRKEKQIRTLHFGDLNESSMADIWNTPAYAAFRAEGLRADMPRCSDCAGGVCTEVTNLDAPFEHDCYGLEIPCGHCPWPTGRVACLS